VGCPKERLLPVHTRLSIHSQACVKPVPLLLRGSVVLIQDVAQTRTVGIGDAVCKAVNAPSGICVWHRQRRNTQPLQGLAHLGPQVFPGPPQQEGDIRRRARSPSQPVLSRRSASAAPSSQLRSRHRLGDRGMYGVEIVCSPMSCCRMAAIVSFAPAPGSNRRAFSPTTQNVTGTPSSNSISAQSRAISSASRRDQILHIHHAVRYIVEAN